MDLGLACKLQVCLCHSVWVDANVSSYSASIPASGSLTIGDIWLQWGEDPSLEPSSQTQARPYSTARPCGPSSSELTATTGAYPKPVLTVTLPSTTTTVVRPSASANLPPTACGNSSGFMGSLRSFPTATAGRCDTPATNNTNSWVSPRLPSTIPYTSLGHRKQQSYRLVMLVAIGTSLVME